MTSGSSYSRHGTACLLLSPIGSRRRFAWNRDFHTTRVSASAREVGPLEHWPVEHLEERDYFEQWLADGISESTLIGLREAADLRNACNSDALSRLDFDVRFATRTASAWRSRRVLASSLALATAIALGIDSARLSNVADMVPTTGSVTVTFWWILMCLSILPMAAPPPRAKPHQAARVFASVAVVSLFLWAVAAFLVSGSARADLGSDAWGPFVVVVNLVAGVLAAGGQYRDRIHWNISR